MVKRLMRICLLIRVFAELSAAGPVSKSASKPASTQSVDLRLPESFAIFRTVNPFSSKHHSTSAGVTAEKGGPEASIVLDGVAQTNGGWTAFFDSGKGNPVLILSVGDPIARGHIQSADLDSITYVFGEQSQHVEVGQNLNGQAPPPTSQPAPPEKEHKPGRLPKGQPPNGQAENGQPQNGPSNAPPSDGQPPQNPQSPNQGN